MDGGRELRTVGSFSRRTGTVAPGRQCVIALAWWTFFTMESPIISTVGGGFVGGGWGEGGRVDSGGREWVERGGGE